jgi:hypothetical protein
VIYVENANSNNCVPARRKNFSFMSDDAQNSADTTHAAGGPATTMGAATNVAVVHRELIIKTRQSIEVAWGLPRCAYSPPPAVDLLWT